MEKKKKKTEKTEETPSFEESLENLEEIVDRLENGDLGLDDALEKFEEGVRLARFCRKKLDEAERKIEILMKKDGKITSVNLPVKEDTGELENDDIQGELL